MSVQPEETSRSHRIIEVQSRKAVKLALTELIVGSELELYPEIEAKGYFSVQFLGRSLQLTAGPYVGLIPINSRVTIDVRPKLPVYNLARIVDLAQRRFLTIERVTRRYLAHGEASTSVLEFLTQSLLKEIDLIKLRGLHRWYRRREENSSHPSGQLNVVRTLRLNVMRGITHKISFSRYDLTTNTAYNQLIKAALWFVAERLSRLADRNRQLLDRLSDAIHEFESVALVDPRGIVPAVQSDLQRDRLTLNRSYYIQALTISLTILQGRSIETGAHGQIELASYIINFETLFEDYLRSVLELKEIGTHGMKVLDGNGSGSRSLFDDLPKPLAQPDIVVHATKTPPVVIDVKYKDKVERSDINQVVTYAATYRTNIAVLVHQYPGSGVSGLNLIGTIGTLKVYSYAFDLASPALPEQEEIFGKAIFALAQSKVANETTVAAVA